jgi:hypothetical protein
MFGQLPKATRRFRDKVSVKKGGHKPMNKGSLYLIKVRTNHA